MTTQEPAWLTRARHLIEDGVGAEVIVTNHDPATGETLDEYGRWVLGPNMTYLENRYAGVYDDAPVTPAIVVTPIGFAGTVRSGHVEAWDLADLRHRAINASAPELVDDPERGQAVRFVNATGEERYLLRATDEDGAWLIDDWLAFVAKYPADTQQRITTPAL